MKRLLFVVLALVFCCTACGQGSAYAREVENLQLIRTVGVDWEDAQVCVTACTGVGSDGQPSRLYTARGQSLAQALDALRRSFRRGEAYLAHTEHVVLGAGAENLLDEVLDVISRSAEIRMATNLFVVKECSARELMESCQGKEESVSDVLTALQREAPRLGTGAVFSCADVLAALAESGCALIQAVVTTPAEELSDGAPEKTASADGFAVIREGTIATYTNQDETAGILLLGGRLRMTAEVIGAVTLEITDVSARVETSDLTEVSVSLSVNAAVAADAEGLRLTDETARRELEQTLERIVLDRVRAALELAQSLRADVCGLCPRLAETAGRPERRAALFDAHYNIMAEATILRSYDTDDPLLPEVTQ